jgi:hypothetical protein
MPKPRFILRSKRHFDCRGTANQTPSRSHDAVIRVYDAAGNVIETHEHAGEFKRVVKFYFLIVTKSSAYGTVILRISPNPAGGGPKPTLET